MDTKSIVFGEVFAVLLFALLLIIKTSQQAPLQHEVDSPPSGSILIKSVDNNMYEQFSLGQKSWEAIGNMSFFKGRLNIPCSIQKDCYELFELKEEKVEQLIMSLPVKSYQQAQDLFAEECFEYGNCKVTIKHSGSHISVKHKE